MTVGGSGFELGRFEDDSYRRLNSSEVQRVTFQQLVQLGVVKGDDGMLVERRRRGLLSG